MKTALVIPIYNRPEYVKRCFESLEALTVKPDVIVIVDDGSTDSALGHPVSSICAEYHKKVEILLHDKNKGVKAALLTGIEYSFTNGADLVINLDSDAIVKPDFVKRLVELYNFAQSLDKNLICSGFNNPKEAKIGICSNNFCIKAHANGINMCFNREQYEKHIKPALLSPIGNWDYMASESAGKVAITIPSCVQHIGLKSSMGHIGADVAHDFKMLSLPDVTLFGIDSHNPQGIQRAAEICQRDIEYGAVNIITKDLFTKGGSNEKRREDYSRFMIKELTKHFTTPHVLTIHHDGYVLNWKAWDDEFLKYDYIGATWNYKDGRNVGNGGFSLRSKKLCDILANNTLGGGHYHPEDHHIGRTYRKSLEDMGVVFAPEEVANRFSIEAYGTSFDGANRYSGQFGFHGVHADLSMLPQDLQLPPKKPVVNIKKRL